jgi:tetratricopeptide (TPR) repeat protein
VALASNDIYVTWLSLVIVMAAFWLTRKSLTAMGLAIFVVTLAPVLGFVPFIFQAYSTVSDNYLYLPLAGVALIVANGLNTTSHQWPKIAVTIWLIILGALSFHQLSYWQNNLIFFNHVLEVNPQSTEALNNLARQLQNQGQTDQALALYERSLTLAPGNMVGLANYAGCLVALKRYPEAIAFIERALQGHISRDKAPRSLAALNVNLTVAYLNTAHLDLAEQSALRAVEINPNMAMSFYALGLVRKSQGRRDKALIQLQHAVQIEPQNAGFRAALLAAQNGSP